MAARPRAAPEQAKSNLKQALQTILFPFDAQANGFHADARPAVAQAIRVKRQKAKGRTAFAACHPFVWKVRGG